MPEAGMLQGGTGLGTRRCCPCLPAELPPHLGSPGTGNPAVRPLMRKRALQPGEGVALKPREIPSTEELRVPVSAVNSGAHPASPTGR